MSNKKLRLMVTAQCQRECEGCCNKDHDVPPVLKMDELLNYQEVYITGGEPMLVPQLTQLVVWVTMGDYYQANIPTFIYSSKCMPEDVENWQSLYQSIDGITFTIHEKEDEHEFWRLNEMVERFDALSFTTISSSKYKSLRLNQFDHFEMDRPVPEKWDHRRIHWLKDCPLPKGEDFRRL